jgi:hypothetical protein
VTLVRLLFPARTAWAFPSRPAGAAHVPGCAAGAPARYWPRLERVTSYTEMNMVLAQGTGHRCLYFDQESERAAMGYLLGRISDREFHPTGVLVSAIVNYLDANDAGLGSGSISWLRPGACSRPASPALGSGSSGLPMWPRCSLHADGKPSSPRWVALSAETQPGPPPSQRVPAAQIRLHTTAPHSDRDRRPGVTWSMSRPRKGEDPCRDARVVHTSRQSRAHHRPHRLWPASLAATWMTRSAPEGYPWGLMIAWVP